MEIKGLFFDLNDEVLEHEGMYSEDMLEEIEAQIIDNIAVISDGECEGVDVHSHGTQSSLAQPPEQFYIESEKSELENKIVNNKEEAYALYNDYAYKHGFGIRRGKTPKNKKKEITVHEFVCDRNGLKKNKDGFGVTYVRTDTRTNCKARLRFHLIENGKYHAVTHNMVHNHPMVPWDKRHLIRSHRVVGKEALETVINLNASGVGVATSYRLLANEAGGSEFLHFTNKDLSNHLARERNKVFEGCDAKQLLNQLCEMQLKDKDFYYEIELDCDGHITSLFYRDGRMLRDFEMFGDVMVFDTTFNTNKWGMLLAPFIGINHHGKNLLFGAGFIPKENKDSLFWLFRVFSKSMNGKHPETIMTDQAPAMKEPISEVFPTTKHRLCTWHIVENAKQHLRKFYAMEGFAEAFGYVLKYTDTEAEFERSWESLLTTYNCGGVDWIKKLYDSRDHWCPAFSKKVFSGGIISSQKCESTNNAIKKRVSKTNSLVSVFKVLLDIAKEWRSKENVDDFDSLNGNIHLVFYRVPILVHAREIYTKSVYRHFEEEYIRAHELNHEVKTIIQQQVWIYQVWVQEFDLLRHQVCFDVKRQLVQCTCNMYSEVGILCKHALRVFMLHCVNAIPIDYIKNRWRKDAMNRISSFELSSNGNEVPVTVWRTQSMRKFSGLVFTYQNKC